MLNENISLCAPTICQSNPYLTTKISTLQIKVRSDLVVWYNFWENMPSCLTFGSLVATAILLDVDLDERINPYMHSYYADIYVYELLYVLNTYINMLKLSVHPSVHVRMCLPVCEMKCFVWCVAKIMSEGFFFSAGVAIWKSKIEMVAAAAVAERWGVKHTDRNESENESGKFRLVYGVRNNLQIMLHLIRCFGFEFRFLKTHSHAFQKLCCRLMDCGSDSERMEWDSVCVHDMTFNRLLSSFWWLFT